MPFFNWDYCCVTCPYFTTPPFPRLYPKGPIAHCWAFMFKCSSTGSILMTLWGTLNRVQCRQFSLWGNKEHTQIPRCPFSAVCASLCRVTISPVGFQNIYSEASPLAVQAEHRRWLYQETSSWEHLGLWIQRVWEEEGESAESFSEKKDSHGIFGIISLLLSLLRS